MATKARPVVSVQPDGRLLATASEDGTARLWDVATGSSNEPRLRGHKGAVRGCAFSPDGRLLATASDDATARLWDVAAVRGATLRGHRSGSGVAFNPDGTCS